MYWLGPVHLKTARCLALAHQELAWGPPGAIVIGLPSGEYELVSQHRAEICRAYEGLEGYHQQVLHQQLRGHRGVEGGLEGQEKEGDLQRQQEPQVLVPENRDGRRHLHGPHLAPEEELVPALRTELVGMDCQGGESSSAGCRSRSCCRCRLIPRLSMS